MHSTNYFNTLIEIAEDSPIQKAEVPPVKGSRKTVANFQFEMVVENPYKYTSDDVIFGVHAIRNDINQAMLAAERELFFSKGQACFRASPLTKRYGWGVHSNDEGKIALYPAESKDYQELQKNPEIKKIKAMRSKRA